MKLNSLNVTETGLEMFLGPLESAVMRAIWAGNSGSRTVWLYVRERYTSPKMHSEEIAFTSVTTTLNHLARIGMLTRSGDKKAYTYTPTYPNEATFITHCLNQVLPAILGQFPREAGAIIVQYAKGNQNATQSTLS